ncbi:MAG: hypothetical protein JWQ72_4026 [Polaromonas sp.]|nr:hypothetical protein [Polaromonas sp.]
MTTQTTTLFPSAQRAGDADFVSTDMAALASHMNRCASTRGRFFGLQAALESAHSLVCPRMVTAAVLALILLVVVGIV